eukprot:gene385-253_t
MTGRLWFNPRSGHDGEVVVQPPHQRTLVRRRSGFGGTNEWPFLDIKRERTWTEPGPAWGKIQDLVGGLGQSGGAAVSAAGCKPAKGPAKANAKNLNVQSDCNGATVTNTTSTAAATASHTDNSNLRPHGGKPNAAGNSNTNTSDASGAVADGGGGSGSGAVVGASPALSRSNLSVAAGGGAASALSRSNASAQSGTGTGSQRPGSGSVAPPANGTASHEQQGLQQQGSQQQPQQEQIHHEQQGGGERRGSDTGAGGNNPGKGTRRGKGKGKGKNGDMPPETNGPEQRWWTDCVQRLAPEKWARFNQLKRFAPQARFTPVYDRNPTTCFASVNAGDKTFYVEGSGGINKAFDQALGARARGVSHNPLASFVDLHNCFAETQVRKPDTIFEICETDRTMHNQPLVARMKACGVAYSCCLMPKKRYDEFFEGY